MCVLRYTLGAVALRIISMRHAAIGSDRPVVRGHNSVQPCFGAGVYGVPHVHRRNRASEFYLNGSCLLEGTLDATTRKNSVRFKAPLLDIGRTMSSLALH